MLVDFHSHILPGVDDGSTSVEESVEMLRMEALQGISHVVATPHFYAQYDKPERFLERRAAAEAALRAQICNCDGLPRLSMGAEVRYFRGISDSELLPLLTIGGGDCILVELPPAPWPDTVFRELAQIREKQDLIPIVAHIDRYIGPFRTHRIPQRLERLPVLVQANASFFLEKTTAGMAMKMLAADQIHLLGSDCHGTVSRKPNMGGAVERIIRKLGSDAIDRIRSFEGRALKI